VARWLDPQARVNESPNSVGRAGLLPRERAAGGSSPRTQSELHGLLRAIPKRDLGAPTCGSATLPRACMKLPSETPRKAIARERRGCLKSWICV
jgi:hypothetical protein